VVLSTANSNITASDTITAASLTLNAGTGAVTMEDESNDFTGTVTVTAGTTSLKDTNDLIAVLNTTGDTTLVAGGNLTVSGTVSGAGSDLQIRAAKAVLGSLSVDGQLTSTTTGLGPLGGVSQTGGLLIKGNALFIADAGVSQVAALTGDNNDFQGTVSFTRANDGSWANITLADADGGIELGNIDASGTLGVSSTDGAITQAQGTTLTVEGAATFAASKFDEESEKVVAANITLDGANDFNGAVNATGNNITLNDTNGLELGNITASGELKATAETGNIELRGEISADSLVLAAEEGAITQAEGSKLTVLTGPSELTAEGNITLGGANDFNSAVNATGADITLNDVDGLIAVLDATGKSTLTAGGNLAVSGNTGDLTTTTTNGGTTSFGATTISGDLEVTSAGDVVQTDKLEVTGTADISATGAINLNDPANDFNGIVDITGKNITIHDNNSLKIGDVFAQENFNVRTNGDLELGETVVGGDFKAETGNGNLTQTDPLTVVGRTDIDAGNGTVSLNNAANNMADGVVVKAGASSVVGDKQGDAAAAAAAAAAAEEAAAKVAAEKAATDKAAADKVAAEKAAAEKAAAEKVAADEASAEKAAGDKLAADKAAAEKAATNKAAAEKAAADKEAADKAAAEKKPVDPASKVQSTLPNSTPPGTGLSNRNQPDALVLLTTSSTSSTSAETTSNASSNSVNSTGVTVDLQSTSQQDTPLMVSVSVPRGASTVGTGFSFELPENIGSNVTNSDQVQVQLADGSPLPAWLKFDARALRFEATAVPDGAFPIQVVLFVNGQRLLVVISERTD